MKIEFNIGDIFKSDSLMLVNCVNTQGFDSKGIALEFKKRYPNNSKLYKEDCKNNLLVPGGFIVHQDRGKLIGNLATKGDWRANSQYEWIITGLHKIRKYIEENNIPSISLPLVGAGLGSLDERVVQGLIYEEMKLVKSDVRIVIYNRGLHKMK